MRNEGKNNEGKNKKELENNNKAGNAMDEDKKAQWYGYRPSKVDFPFKEVKEEPYSAGKNLSFDKIDDYIINSYEVRMKFLSGLIDRSDHIYNENYRLFYFL